MHVYINKENRTNQFYEFYGQFKIQCGVCVCGRITDLLTPPSFCDRHQCISYIIATSKIQSCFSPNKY